jgi:hypothetical protein
MGEKKKKKYAEKANPMGNAIGSSIQLSKSGRAIFKDNGGLVGVAQQGCIEGINDLNIQTKKNLRSVPESKQMVSTSARDPTNQKNISQHIVFLFPKQAR